MQCYSKGDNQRQSSARLLLISIFIHLGSVIAFSQPWTDVLSIRYISFPLSEIRQQRMVGFHADVAYGVKRGRFTMAINPSFERLNGNWGNSVYSISLPLVYNHTWKDSMWQSSMITIVRINSDLKSISGDDCQIGMANINSIQRSSVLKYKFGYYFNTEFDKFFIIPLAGIEWKASERFLINDLLPTLLISEFKLFPLKMHTGLVFRSFTKSFRFMDGSYLGIRDNYAAFFTDFYFARSVVLNAEFGYSFYRKYKSGIRITERIEHNLNAESGMMFRMAMIYRIRKD